MNAAEYLVRHFGLDKKETLVQVPNVIFLIDWEKAKTREIDPDFISVHQSIVQLGQIKEHVVATTEPAIRPIVGRLIDLGQLVEESCAGHVNRRLNFVEKGNHPEISIIFTDPEAGAMFIMALEEKFDGQFKIDIKGNTSPIFNKAIDDGLSIAACLAEKLPINFRWTAYKPADLATIWKLFSEVLDEFDQAGSGEIVIRDFSRNINFKKLELKKVNFAVMLLKSIETTRPLIQSLETSASISSTFWNLFEAGMMVTFIIVYLVPWLGVLHFMFVPILLIMAITVFFHSIPLTIKTFGSSRLLTKAGNLGSIIISFALILFACHESFFITLKILYIISQDSLAYLC